MVKRKGVWQRDQVSDKENRYVVKRAGVCWTKEGLKRYEVRKGKEGKKPQRIVANRYKQVLNTRLNNTSIIASRPLFIFYLY